MKKLVFKRFNVALTLLGFSNLHSVAGIQVDQKDNPPVVVIPPAK